MLAKGFEGVQCDACKEKLQYFSCCRTGPSSQSASCYRTMGDSFPCMAESWPTARKKSKQEETQYLLIYCLECSNPEMISGSF